MIGIGNVFDGLEDCTHMHDVSEVPDTEWWRIIVRSQPPGTKVTALSIPPCPEQNPCELFNTDEWSTGSLHVRSPFRIHVLLGHNPRARWRQRGTDQQWLGYGRRWAYCRAGRRAAPGEEACTGTIEASSPAYAFRLLQVRRPFALALLDLAKMAAG